MMRLAHFHFRHPIKDLARIEVAENPTLELEEERRMQRIAEIEQDVRTGQPVEQFLSRKADESHGPEVVRVARRRLVQQAIGIFQSMFVKPPLKDPDARFIFTRIRRGW